MAASTFSKVFTCIKYRAILGLTATLERLDGRHKIIEKYCPIVDSVSLEVALANGWVSQFQEYLVLLEVPDIEQYQEYNKDFIRHFEFFSYNFNLVMSCIGRDGFKFRQALRDQMYPMGKCSTQERKDGLRDITYHATAFSRALQARKKFINNHPFKIEIARKIIEARSDKKIITFSNNIKMAESIGIGEVYSGKDSKAKGRTTIEEWLKKSSGVLNTIKKADTGFNDPNMSVAIMLGLDSSKTKAIQKTGRVIRKAGNKRAEIFNLVINHTVELKWYQNSHPDHNYKTIDLDGLDAVLNGKTVVENKQPLEDFVFRF